MSVRNVVVGVVYKKDNNDIKFLVLHRILLWKGWEFPKGGVENEESAENALLRELKEETGLENVRIIERLPYKIKYRYPKKYEKQFKHSETIQSVFLVRSFQEDIRTTEEHDDFHWLSYKEARKLLTHRQQKKALDVAFQSLNRGLEKP